MKRSTTIVCAVVAALLVGAGVLGYRYVYPNLDAPAAETFDILDAQNKVIGKYQIPRTEDIAKQSNAQSIMLGRRLLNETARLLPNNVGDDLNCNSCHIAEGKRPFGNNYINAGANGYPRYMSRPGKVIDLAERINGCLQRSMNGKPLPTDSLEMRAMLDYMHWLGAGVPEGAHVAIVSEGPIDTTLKPDTTRGQALYVQQCASCHGDNGQGRRDASGDIAFPPLWGDDSYNIGAGLARLYKAAGFVKYNMPPAVTREPPLGQTTLSDQDAVDIAGWFITQPRPDFAGKANDWPHDPKPKDARY